MTDLDQLIDDAIRKALWAGGTPDVACLDTEYSRLDHDARTPDPNYADGRKAGVEVVDVNPTMRAKLYANQILKILIRQILGKEPEAKSYTRWRAMAGCSSLVEGVTLERACMITAIAKHRCANPGKPYDQKAIKRIAKGQTHRKNVYGMLEALEAGTVLGKELPIVLASYGLVRDFADLRKVLPGFSVNRYYSINTVLGLVRAGGV